jgi:hypothetical protein
LTSFACWEKSHLNTEPKAGQKPVPEMVFLNGVRTAEGLPSQIEHIAGAHQQQHRQLDFGNPRGKQAAKSGAKDHNCRKARKNAQVEGHGPRNPLRLPFDMDITNTIASNTKRIQEQKKLTLDAAATVTGISRRMLAQIEKAR